jgi:histidinol-phosphatase (PHP family)
LFDSHVHTVISTDSKMEILDALNKSEETNTGIVLTEHMDLDFPLKGQFMFDVPEYFSAYSKYRSNSLLLGVELGMKKNVIKDNNALVTSYPFDYVVASIHLVENQDLYYEKYYKNKTKQIAYDTYLKTILENIKAHDFADSLGHIDYICRYARYDDKEIYYNEHSELIDEIFKSIIQNEIALEINTRRFENLQTVKNMLDIYKRYYELGGRIVTVGSDAHKIEAICSNFKYAREIAELCNLKIVYFRERKPYYEIV